VANIILTGQQPAAQRATGDDTVAAVHQAIGVISAVCDYAQELDARGFSAADAWLGHVLAQMPPGLWSDSAALTAWDMLRKYRGQLSTAGIDYDQLPRPAGADELEADQREQARDQVRQDAREHARQWREQQYRQAHSYVRCDGDGEQVTLAFPYDPDLVAACRAIEGRRYDGAAKANVFPFTSLPAVIELADRHGIEVTADVRALAAIAAGRAAERAAQPQVRLDEQNGAILIDASLGAALYDRAKDFGGRWDRTTRAHRFPGHHAPALVSLADEHGLGISDQARQFAADTAARQKANRAAADAFHADPVPVPGLAEGMPLKPQQYPVVRFALEHRRVLVGDDMGWGKTLSSLAAVAADGAYPAVVVCRPSLTLNWAAEIRRFFPALMVDQATGTSPQPIPAGADVIIIGSAALAAKPRKTADGGKEFGWVEELTKTGPRALIIDEGQDTKERAANRSQACEQLAAAVIARDGLVLDLTGTAILNRPRELCQQLTILGRIREFGGPKKFLWRYCLSETSQWGASYNGARNLIELHDRLRAWGIMIRRSDDAALGLPPCREHVLRIPQEQLDTAVMDRYRQAEADLLGFLAGQARQAADRLGQDPDSAAVEAAMRASAAEHLVAINTLRQLAGQAKRGYVTGWVRERVAAGEKVMVAAHHRDQVDAYAAAFGGLKLQGGQPVAEKEAVKARFQQQPADQAPVIAVAIGAGGVGHTLTAARIGIQAEQAWTPGETQQMKKRLHRIGQDRAVDYYITIADGTIDEHLRAVVTAKQATLDAVLDGRSDTGAAADERSVAAELTWRLTQQGLGSQTSDHARTAAQVLTQDAEPAPGNQSGEDTSHDGARLRLFTGPRPGHDGSSGRAAGANGSGLRAGTRHGAEPGTDDHAAPGRQERVQAKDASQAVAAIASGRPVYGTRDEITIRHWREAHVDPDKVRAWCRDTGRQEPPARGPLPGDLVADYLTERGATDIPMPGGPGRAGWLAQRPVLRQPFTARFGPFTVVYGPCPRCGHPTAADPGQTLPLCMDCATRPDHHDHGAVAAGGSGEPPRGAASGSGTGQPCMPAPAASHGDDDEVPAQARITGQQLREAAHRYLENGLLPVPAWAARQTGECCCPRGAHCDRPGKHPRSVHTGPGPRDYSWKPLACHTHAEIDQRFAPGGPYTAGNLMLAIPTGMMAIDVDDDDGGRAAAAQLASELGQLPPTLSHRTPHGEHRIYRTPPGWTGRAWVGKDPANPVPPGVDLRMPGQILMATPSAVPGPDGPARYGPVTGDHVADLPAAYVTAWTPPQAPLRPAGPRVPVPPGSADRAARYVHDAMTRIAADLASREPGGRNAAAYAAGLKAGSLLGAARATPGAEHAAAGWTDEEAEQALIDAAERNGYTGKDGQAEARRAIRSGLRNGLRNPRALPDFTTPSPAPERRQPTHRPAPSNAARQPRNQAAAAAQTGRWQDLVPDDIRHEIEAADTAASNRRRTAVAAHQQALERHDRSATADTAAEVERTRAAAHAAHRAYTHDGRHITGRHDAAMLRWAAAFAAEREKAAAAQPASGLDNSAREQANRAAVAANEAYRAGDLNQARQLVDQAAALDPSRADLWQQDRDQIAARRLILAAQAARADADHQRAQVLLDDARQLDPRMPALWDGDLPAVPPTRPVHADMSAPGLGSNANTFRTADPRHRTPTATASGDGGSPHPSWPSSPARREPRHPAPASAQAHEPEPMAQRFAAAASCEVRRDADATADDPNTDAATSGTDPSAWPAPNPRIRHEDVSPTREAGHQTGTATETEASNRSPGTRDAAPSADWRDDILSAAREPSQSGPRWPDNPALHRSPDVRRHEPGIEAGN
jgi:hypothetical protein